ncbi:MAG: hypothetical protein ACI8W8_002597 [Rhodothermales bacterium]|jgi:hypothetical protein
MRSLLLVVIASLAGCGGDPPAPREAEVIFQEQQTLDGLYFTRSGKRVTAPLNNGIFLDSESGEICFPAVACHNPECPDGSSTEPHLFIIDDPSVVLTADGRVGTNMNAEIRSSEPAVEALLTGHCPACIGSRDLTRESRAEWDDYSRFVRPYMPPETQSKMRRLDAERKRSESEARRRK